MNELAKTKGVGGLYLPHWIMYFTPPQTFLMDYIKNFCYIVIMKQARMIFPALGNLTNLNLGWIMWSGQSAEAYFFTASSKRSDVFFCYAI